MAMPMPANEPERLASLHALRILDTQPEPGFDDAVALAAQICGAPITYVSFIEMTRLWMKAHLGIPPEYTECPREIAFCATTICGADLLIVPDLTEDARFADFAVVKGEPRLRFYCGMPLITSEGHALGTLCALDFAPRVLSLEQADAMRRLGRQVVAQIELRRKMIDMEQTLREREEAQARARGLLRNILPQTIADELDSSGRVQTRFYPSTTIMFADFKDFTRQVERMEPATLVALLHQYFAGFDEIIDAARLEKLKTIGDAYMAAGGLPAENRTHAVDACLAALRIQAQATRLKLQRERARLPTLELRVGLHTGPVIAGLVGTRKFTYDIWGDTVNVAARMEAHGEPGRINISQSTADRVGTLFELEARGTIEVKNRGALAMYFLNRIKPDFAQDHDGILPSERFQSEYRRLSGA